MPVPVLFVSLFIMAVLVAVAFGVGRVSVSVDVRISDWSVHKD
jgi:hypothetical protein